MDASRGSDVRRARRRRDCDVESENRRSWKSEAGPVLHSVLWDLLSLTIQAFARFPVRLPGAALFRPRLYDDVKVLAQLFRIFRVVFEDGA